MLLAAKIRIRRDRERPSNGHGSQGGHMRDHPLSFGGIKRVVMIPQVQDLGHTYPVQQRQAQARSAVGPQSRPNYTG